MYHIITTLYISLILFLSLKPFIGITSVISWSNVLVTSKSHSTISSYLVALLNYDIKIETYKRVCGKAILPFYLRIGFNFRTTEGR